MNDANKFSRRDVALLILLALLVALFFWRILTPNPADRAQFPVGDFTDQFYAFRLYEARAFSEGRIPLWSENFNSGHPFLADIQSAVFYPPALVNTWANVWAFNSFSLFALELEALLHFCLAGAFTYIFARRVIQNRVGAFVSAIVFTFGGYLTSYPSLQLAILETAVWLPLALYCVNRATDDGRRTTNWLILAGVVLGIAALAGHPQTFLFVFATSVIYFLFRVWQSNQKSEIKNQKSKIGLRAFGSIVILALLAFGIAAIQWIPAIEYQQLSTREALSFADAAKGFPTLDLLQFILPGYASAFASPLYVGILPLWLALFALLRKRNETIFWGLLALGALILSFGFYVFAYVVIYLFVPGASLFRQQERLAFVISFALAMLAGYGITDLLNGINLKRANKLYALLPIGAALMLVLMLTFFVAGAQQPEGRLAFLGDRAGLLLIQFALASLLLGLYLRKIISIKWFAPLAIVLILFDLWSVNEPANKGRVEERFADIPFLEQLQSDPAIFRVAADDQVLPGHFGIATGLEEIGGISPLRLARYDALLKLPAEIYLPLLNVKYLVTRENAAGAELLEREGEIQLSQLRNSQPRAWLVGNAVSEANDARALELAARLDLAHNAIVADATVGALDPRAADGEVSIAAHSAEQMTLDVNTPADGLLIVSENFYPGWRAIVDGTPTEILRADLTLRAIPVRAGQHHIEMWYDPISFKLGAMISAITLLGCVGALLFFRNRR
ncbi:MAG: hypothetical protein EYC68_19225 [Chloroflexota bacterium]|nr:MAG: hypothetical protein EYC68_19225 [Chloroflexota bacterium]